MTGHWWLKNCDYSFNSVSVAFVGQFAIPLSCKSLLNSKIGSKITIISKSVSGLQRWLITDLKARTDDPYSLKGVYI